MLVLFIGFRSSDWQLYISLVNNIRKMLFFNVGVCFGVYFWLIKYLEAYGFMRKGKEILGDETIANHCSIACLTLFIFAKKVMMMYVIITLSKCNLFVFLYPFMGSKKC